MSGGALDYIHNRLQDTAEQISRYSQSRQDRDQLQAFAGAIQHFAEVLRAIDYDLSDDQSLSAGMYDAMDMYTKVAKGVCIRSPGLPVVKDSLTTAPKPKAECDGRYGYRSLSNCYCHISSPCYECVENPLVCLDCGDDLPDAEIPEAQGGATT